SELRAVADRRPVGNGARAGAGRGDRDLRRARPRLARGGTEAAAVPVPAAPGGVPLAYAGIDELWQEPLPRLVEECAAQWGLELEEPFLGGFVSHVVPVGDAVLKIQWPHRESEHEADALEQWRGDGAVRLLARDDERHALLLERCRPGAPLREDALDVFVDLLPRLWKPAGSPFTPLADEAAWWVSTMGDQWEEAGRPFEARLIDAAISMLEELAATEGGQLWVHKAPHPDTVLAEGREPWLVIDPKPLIGEREFAVAPIVRASELGQSRRGGVARAGPGGGGVGLLRARPA